MENEAKRKRTWHLRFFAGRVFNLPSRIPMEIYPMSRMESRKIGREP